MTYLEELKNQRAETIANTKIDENHKKDIIRLIDLYIKREETVQCGR